MSWRKTYFFIVFVLILPFRASGDLSLFRFNLESGVAFLIEDPQRTRFGIGVGAGIKGKIFFFRWLALQGLISFLEFVEQEEENTAQVYGIGFKFCPFERFWFDGDISYVRVKRMNRIGFSAGLGYEFFLAPFLDLGPFLRYKHIPQVQDQKAIRYVILGVATSLKYSPQAEREVILFDNDRDQVLDQEDRCPKVAEDRDGFEDSDGCPEPDNDRDQVLDQEDRCPKVAEDRDGFEDSDGCPEPDNDGDGVLDPKDLCPMRAETINGFKDKDGCPDQAPEKVVEEVEILKKRIYFKVDQAQIELSDYKLLKEIARFLIQHPEIEEIQIEGHTDSRGPEEWNQRLSLMRAQAVKRFLIREGVSAKRLKVKGYGSRRPLHKEETPFFRRLNRRVEFRIIK
jgi:outer membrane protein OmpA-like peptidoglycan-associated protein